MKSLIIIAIFLFFEHFTVNAQVDTAAKNLYIDVHEIPGGKVNFQDVAAAHVKDLATQDKYKVNFLKYWVDEQRGLVYCLSTATDSNSIRQTHAAAHGLLPKFIIPVMNGTIADTAKDMTYFLDIHHLGAGKVTADAVEKAHQKDLAVQKKHQVRFINYWVDENSGTVLCLSQAPGATNVVDTHREAHGLLPDYISPVKQGQ